MEALLGVAHAQEQGLYPARVNAHLEREGAETSGLDTQHVLRHGKRHGGCPEKCPARMVFY